MVADGLVSDNRQASRQRGALICTGQVVVGVGNVRSVAAVLVGKEQLANLKVELLGVGDEIHLIERLILGC